MLPSCTRGHTHTTPSPPPLARYRPSGDQCSPHTSWEWAARVRRRCSATLTSWWWMSPDLEPLGGQKLSTLSPSNLESFCLWSDGGTVPGQDAAVPAQAADSGGVARRAPHPFLVFNVPQLKEAAETLKCRVAAWQGATFVQNQPERCSRWCRRRGSFLLWTRTESRRGLRRAPVSDYKWRLHRWRPIDGRCYEAPQQEHCDCSNQEDSDLGKRAIVVVRRQQSQYSSAWEINATYKSHFQAQEHPGFCQELEIWQASWCGCTGP